MKPPLLVFVNDETLRNRVGGALAGTYQLHIVQDLSAAVGVVERTRPEIAIIQTDLADDDVASAPSIKGIILILKIHPAIKIIALGQREIRNFLTPMLGSEIHELLNTNFLPEELKYALGRCCELTKLERDCLKTRIRLGDEGTSPIIGNSPQMIDVIAEIRKCTITDFPILISGESGTGKELAARTIHDLCPRRLHAFAAVNCGALSPENFSQEVFGEDDLSPVVLGLGDVEGTFGGTLFLDELADAEPEVRTWLMHLLQRDSSPGGGGNRPLTLNFRLIAGTCQDLPAMVEAGEFPVELLKHFSVHHLHLPPLRERGSDIALLAHYFLRKFIRGFQKAGISFNHKAIMALQHYKWPGNVRELENRIQRAVIMCDKLTIGPEDLDLPEFEPQPIGITLQQARRNLESELLRQSLIRHSGNISASARELRISRPTFYGLLEKYALRIPN